MRVLPRPAAVAELVALLQEKAPTEGTTVSALPGLWLFRSDRPRPPVRSRTSTMVLAVAAQGRKRVQIGGLALGYDPLSYLVMRGEIDCESEIIEASARHPYLAIGLQIPPDLVVHTLLEIVDGQRAPAHIVAPAPAFVSQLDDPLVGALGRLVRTLDDPAERRVLAPLIVREVVFRLLRTDAAAVLRQAASQNGERGRIREAIAYIEQRAAHRLSVDAIARHVAMSPSHFAHRFREIASISPMQYLKHVRLERARTLLLADGLSAAEVARGVGYASASHFTRDFKRHFGLSPSSYARAFERGGTASPSADEPAEAVA